MADLLQMARAKRAALMQEVTKLEAFIRTAEQLEREAGSTPTQVIASSLAADVVRHLPSFDFDVRVGQRISKKDQVLQTCRQLIGDQGPLSLNQLYAALQSRQIDPGSKDPKGMLSVMLSRSDAFVSDKTKGVWKLAKSAAPTGSLR